jgi:hypothetical protein
MKNKSRLRTCPRDNGWASRSLFAWFSFLLLFGLAANRTAKAAEIQSPPVTWPGPGPQFAIADFDGDLRPDLASVQAGSNRSGHTDYWIQLQLSAGGRQSIRVIAPAGGLLIEARDVNGDHAVDLVLATAWFRQPVAIFLNDGHGNFSRVEPAAFPQAFSESTANWASVLGWAADTPGILPPSRTGISPETTALPDLRWHSNSIPSSNAGLILNSFLASHPGRAPPSDVPYF